MATLHLVNRARALAGCLELAAPEDAILLIEDGVYGAIAAAAPARQLYALAADVTARGLEKRLAHTVLLANDADFVALAVAHQPIVSWR